MQLSIGQRILEVRKRQFVGRNAELDLLRFALLSPELPFALLYLHGPGGIGKTTLLQSFAVLCASLSVPYYQIDARNIKPSKEAFLEELRRLLAIPSTDDPINFLSTVSKRCVLFIDTFEMLEETHGLSEWLRDSFLPRISAEVLIVVAGRQSPSTAWPLDSGWQSVCRIINLSNFSAEESQMYLSQRSVPAEAHDTAFRFTHGHPLALSLIADMYAHHPQTDKSLLPSPGAAPPEVIYTLLKRFLNETPNGLKKSALEVCALVRVTNQVLLKEMLFPRENSELEKAESIALDSSAEEETASLFDWLRNLSFIESGTMGLFPHDIAREAMLADLRWRNPDWNVELHRRARVYYTRRLQQASNAEQQKNLLYDCIFLHRDSETVRAAFTWKEVPTIAADPLQPGDAPAIIAMVATHEGEESAQIARHWLAVQPEATLVFRDTSRSQEPIAFLTMLSLHTVSAEALAVDPATKSAWEYIQENSPLRSGEGATYLRFWMAHDTYQQTSPLQSLLIVHALHHFLTRGHRLAYTFFCCRSPEAWQQVFNYTGISRINADFTLDSHSFGVFGHDWRPTPLMEWIARMAEKEVNPASVYRVLQDVETRSQESLPTVRPPASHVVLNATEFAEAVRAALRDLHIPTQLEQSPLLRSHVVENGSIETLKIVILNAAETMNIPNPRQQRGYQALRHTYLTPQSTQEAAARLLDLPFSTYRRHLAEGIMELTDILWKKEIGRSNY